MVTVLGVIRDKEVELLTLCADGFTTMEIANKLDISPRTVEAKLDRLREKLHAPHKPALIAKAFRLRIIK
jgi:DNA-binding CsgD family transcriptional regulator